MQQYTYCNMYPEELEALSKLFASVSDFSDTMSTQVFNETLGLGKIQLWVEPNAEKPVAAMVTELHDGAGRKYVTVLAFAGKNVDDKRQMFAAIKRWALKNNCTSIRAVCKDAQARLFARDGFVKIANVVELEISDEE